MSHRVEITMAFSTQCEPFPYYLSNLLYSHFSPLSRFSKHWSHFFNIPGKLSLHRLCTFLLLLQSGRCWTLPGSMVHSLTWFVPLWPYQKAYPWLTLLHCTYSCDIYLFAHTVSLPQLHMNSLGKELDLFPAVYPVPTHSFCIIDAQEIFLEWRKWSWMNKWIKWYLRAQDSKPENTRMY